MKLYLNRLGLPEDVIHASGDAIPLYGEETNDADEIIVLIEDVRTILSAYVCKIKTEENGYDIMVPKHGHLIFPSLSNVSIRTIDGKKYTMMCISSWDRAVPNWIF